MKLKEAYALMCTYSHCFKLVKLDIWPPVNDKIRATLNVLFSIICISGTVLRTLFQN